MKKLILIAGLILLSNVWAEEVVDIPSGTFFAIVDVETTGLDPNYNEIIDIGLILMDQVFEVKGRFYTKVNPSFPDRIHPVAKQINGYDQHRWKKENALSEEVTVIKLTDFLQNYEKKPIFIAFNSWFDASFVRKLFSDYGQQFDDWFDYRVLDIPSMALACGYFPQGSEFNTHLAEILKIEPETNDPLMHTGESGVNFNYAILKSLKEKDCFLE